jgi:hypothetical protein
VGCAILAHENNFFIRLARRAVICVLVLKITTAPAQMTTNSFLSLAQTNGGAMSLTVSNSGDQVWTFKVPAISQAGRLWRA